ncbi:hypothetical protein K438DRAFT_1945599 [Mycena galopus ATCC 62051]|nr:hypothetical protein K438DRAFT_1945599 [Mycena galopus ATCC 62051]
MTDAYQPRTWPELEVDNPSIEKDDTILVYYAGHGSRAVALDSWPPTDGKIETMVTHDEPAKNPQGEIIHGIPDRTINVLLSNLATAKGNNITVAIPVASRGDLPSTSWARDISRHSSRFQKTSTKHCETTAARAGVHLGGGTTMRLLHQQPHQAARSIGLNRITYAELLGLLPTLPNQNPYIGGGSGSSGRNATRCVRLEKRRSDDERLHPHWSSLVVLDLSVQQLRPSFLIVNSLNVADLAVKRESLEEFLLTRLDPKISRYITRDVKLAVPPENLPYVLDAVAQFNYFLARHNGSDPLEMRNEVRMAMYSLRGEYGHRMPHLDIGNVVIDGEARSLHNSDDKYGFAIFNHSQHDLFPYLIYFDPGTYSIDVSVVVPESPTMAPPLPRMPGDGPTRLTIGYGADGGYAFQFFVPEGITSDTGFLKLIRVHEVPGLEVH